jgi:hypothetical protein
MRLQVERFGEPLAHFGGHQEVGRMVGGGGTREEPAKQHDAFGDGAGARVGFQVFPGAQGAVALEEFVGTDAAAPRA